MASTLRTQGLAEPPHSYDMLIDNPASTAPLLRQASSIGGRGCGAPPALVRTQGSLLTGGSHQSGGRGALLRASKVLWSLSGRRRMAVRQQQRQALSAAVVPRLPPPRVSALQGRRGTMQLHGTGLGFRAM